PETFDDLIKVCDAVDGKDGVKAFVADKLHHWNWIPYLMGNGGTVFKAPPENLTPTFATPEAIAASILALSPDVVGLSEGDAKAALEAAGFTVNSDLVVGLGSVPGDVVAQDPVGGTRLRKGDEVVIKVAVF
ncbi:MAG: PASTA domain-containing protein, partial [Actinomycetes bacterium]